MASDAVSATGVAAAAGRRNAPYRHYDVGTCEEFDFYLKKWRGTTFNDFPILYLSFHGAPGELHVGEGRDKSLSLEDLAERLDGGCRGRVVHLGSCGTVDVHGRELKKFLSRTGALAVCGFRENVNWLESAAFDMLVLGRLQGASFQRTSSIRKFDEELNVALRAAAPALARRSVGSSTGRGPRWRRGGAPGAELQAAPWPAGVASWWTKAVASASIGAAERAGGSERASVPATGLSTGRSPLVHHFPVREAGPGSRVIPRQHGVRHARGRVCGDTLRSAESGTLAATLRGRWN